LRYQGKHRISCSWYGNMRYRKVTDSALRAIFKSPKKRSEDSLTSI
jgi:hypothetical protein